MSGITPIIPSHRARYTIWFYGCFELVVLKRLVIYVLLPSLALLRSGFMPSRCCAFWLDLFAFRSPQMPWSFVFRLPNIRCYVVRAWLFLVASAGRYLCVVLAASMCKSLFVSVAPQGRSGQVFVTVFVSWCPRITDYIGSSTLFWGCCSSSGFVWCGFEGGVAKLFCFAFVLKLLCFMLFSISRPVCR